MRHLVEQAGLVDRIEVDSAGTGDWHLGHAPDARTVDAARRRGLALDHRARLFTADDFARFDLILAMDGKNLHNVQAMATTEEQRAKVRMLRGFDPAAPPDAEVPDPYYGGADGFEEVFDVCEAACRGLLDHLRPRLDAP